MCFVKLGFSNIDVIAPDSENSMLTETQVSRLKTKYKTICVLFDNDGPGIASMEKYRDRYGFESILLPMEKDLSDSVAVHGLIKVREELSKLLEDPFKLKL